MTKSKDKISGVLITGGGGFLGSHLAEYFLTQQIPCIVIDNFCTGSRANKDHLLSVSNKTQFLFIEADVSQNWSEKILPKISKFKAPISHVFHFASPASPPLYQKLAFETMAVNTQGLQNALDFADSKNARVIFSSTSEIYGDPLVHPQPESYRGNVNTMGPRACYDEAKRFGETIIFTHNWKHETKHGLVRIFNTYGPRMNPHDGRVVINFLMQAMKNEPLSIFGDGHQTRSFCYVSDLIAGIVAYAQADLTIPVNLGNDREFTILELAQAVQNLCKLNQPLKFLPLPEDDPIKRKPVLNQARTLLSPWTPQVELSSGLAKMLDWLKTMPASEVEASGNKA